VTGDRDYNAGCWANHVITGGGRVSDWYRTFRLVIMSYAIMGVRQLYDSALQVVGI
jgi:hypothetical protein